MFIAVSYLLQVHAICIDTKVLQLLTTAAGRHEAEVLVEALVEAADTVVSPLAPVSISLEAFAKMLKPCLSTPSLRRDFRLQQLKVLHCLGSTHDTACSAVPHICHHLLYRRSGRTRVAGSARATLYGSISTSCPARDRCNVLCKGQGVIIRSGVQPQRIWSSKFELHKELGHCEDFLRPHSLCANTLLFALVA